MTDTYQTGLAEAARKAAAILREDADRTRPEKAALDVLRERAWVLWHAHDRDLGVVRLLSAAGLLRDAEHEEQALRAAVANAKAVEAQRVADARLISTLGEAVEQACGRLEAGGDGREVAEWLRAVRKAAWDAHDRTH
ncbi:MAG TPA: hypothetical protein VIS29_23005 [Streptomyces sp.]